MKRLTVGELLDMPAPVAAHEVADLTLEAFGEDRRFLDTALRVATTLVEYGDTFYYLAKTHLEPVQRLPDDTPEAW